MNKTILYIYIYIYIYINVVVIMIHEFIASYNRYIKMKTHCAQLTI